MLLHDAQPPIETRDAAHKYLEPPERDKQFLISPPASPPVGWEVIGEREPAINYDLINAIARMGPGNYLVFMWHFLLYNHCIVNIWQGHISLLSKSFHSYRVLLDSH